jgi:hypothetical protein
MEGTGEREGDDLTANVRADTDGADPSSRRWSGVDPIDGWQGHVYDPFDGLNYRATDRS